MYLIPTDFVTLKACVLGSEIIDLVSCLAQNLNTPLHCAVWWGHDIVADIILRHRGNLTEKNQVKLDGSDLRIWVHIVICRQNNPVQDHKESEQGGLFTVKES